MWKTSNPRKSGLYLTTRINATNKSDSKRWIDVARYDSINEIWYATDWEKVIAWKPLPEIYRGEWE